MPKKNKTPFKFWHELKRRKVFRVLAMYAGAAYVIIELVNNIAEPLGLPAWTATVVILLLAVGFPIVAILSWIFDITPSGVVKTGPINATTEQELPLESGRRKLRVSDVVIMVLVVVVGILLYPKIFHRDKLGNIRDSDGKISLAVMPFENLSGDTTYNVWQGGLQNLLITTLSNSEELSVRRYHAVNEVIDNNNNLNLASLTPSFASSLAQKLDTKTFVIGNILKSGNKVRINAQLVDAETEEIYKTYQVDGDSENDFFPLADSLSGMIKNYIEIKKISDQYNSLEIKGNSLTNSSEAFKHYIRGYNAFKYEELGSAVSWFKKAIEADTSFIQAYVFLSYANLMSGNERAANYWANIAYKKRSDLPTEEKLIIDQLNAYYNETPYEEITYIKQLIEIDELNPLYWHQLAFAYYKLFAYEDAIRNWEQIFLIHEKWGTDYINPYTYFLMGDAYHKLDEHEKEEEILALGNRVHPNAIMIQQHQAICAFSKGDIEKANEILIEYKSIRQDVLHCTEAMISTGIGVIYSSSNMFDEAEDYYRQSIQLEPDNLVWVRDFAWFLIDNDINIEEGLALSENILESFPEYWPSLDAKGWALYKLGKYDEALEILKDSWDLKPAYSHTGYLHIQEAEKAVESQSQLIN